MQTRVFFVAGLTGATGARVAQRPPSARTGGSIKVGSSLRKSSLSLLGLALVVGLLTSVPAALAIEANPTRDEYVAAVDPICKQNSEANSHILNGTERLVKKGELVPAGKRFIRASGALGKAVGQIAAVPKPAADTAKLTKWIGLLKSEKTYLGKVGGYLKAEKKSQAYYQGEKLEHANRLATNAIVGFGFHYCTISKSSFH
jgi:hypothetical protein